MSCEGWITHTDKTLGYCEINKKYIVYLSILRLNNSDFKLPRKPGKISIKKALSPLENCYICTENSIIETSSVTSTNFESTEFIYLLKNHNFVIEILNLACKVTTILKNHFIITEEHFKQQLILQVLKELLRIETKPSITILKSVHECKSVNLLMTNCNSFPTWSFEVQTEDKQMLFGHLVISPLHGCFFLEDTDYKFRLILPNTYFKDISRLDETYVLLRNYKTFSEISNNANVPNLKYLYVNLDDVIVVGSKKQASSNRIGTTITKQKYTNFVKFCLERKSSVWIGSKLEPEYYLEVLVTESNTYIPNETIYLTLPLVYVPIYLQLKEENEYTLFYNELKVVTPRELQYRKNCKNFQLTDENAYFQEHNVSKEYSFKTNVLTIQQCKEIILTQTNQMNVQGVITKKTYGKQLDSKIPKRSTNIYGFGTPGFQTHQVTFKFKDSDGSVKFLDCYVCDWDNILNPIGLVPQMRVLIKNVMPQSKRYLKPTIFTSFEIISYEPVVEFNTPVLNGGIEELTWGKPFFLGLGEHLPDGVIVWGKVSNFYITKINMTNNCKMCKSATDIAGFCLKCGCTERIMKFMLVMQAIDQFKEVKILADDPTILKNILNLPENQFCTWLENFSQLESYVFNIFEGSLYQAGNSADNFKLMLTNLLLYVNKSFNELEIKCRHMFSKYNKGSTQYYYLDSRRNIV